MLEGRGGEGRGGEGRGGEGRGGERGRGGGEEKECERDRDHAMVTIVCNLEHMANIFCHIL